MPFNIKKTEYKAIVGVPKMTYYIICSIMYKIVIIVLALRRVPKIWYWWKSP